MGSLCGGNTQTTTSQQSTTPTNLAGLQSIFGQVQNAAQTPFTPYTGELTAPVNSQQQAGIAGVNTGANAAQPYYGTAANYATQAGSPLTAAAIQSYIDPNVQNVIKATQANFDEGNGQQQQQVKGSAALAGALGGDRQAVAQAETARQQQLAQAPVIASLQSDAYTKAVAAAQADRSAAGNAAGTFGNLGTAAQQAALQGAGAQINAGTLEQQTQQQADAAKLQQFQVQQAYPFQTAQFAAQYGTPAALAQGSSTSGTQTAPGPNILAQLAGLGIAGAGVASKFAADGGRIKFADGGSPFNFINDVHGYVPTGGNAPQIALPQTQLKFADPAKPDMSPITSALSGIGKGTFKNPFSSSGSGGWGATDTGAEGVGSLGGLYSHGGLVDAIHSIHRAIKHSRGGSVGGSPFTSFADGGAVKDDGTLADGFVNGAKSAWEHARWIAGGGKGSEPAPYMGGKDYAPRKADGGSLDDRFGAVQEALADGSFDAVGKNSTTFEAAPAPFRLDRSAVAPDDAPSIVPAPASPMRAALPPQITGAPQDDSEPGAALAFDSTAKSPLALVPPDAATEAPQAKSPFFSPKASDAMIAAGLGIMASRSPFALSALGEGGLHGLKSYSDATAAEAAAADKKITHDQAAQRILREIEAQKETARHNKATEAKEFKPTWGVIGKDPNTGFDEYGWVNPNKMKVTDAQGKDYNPTKAKPDAVDADGKPLAGDDYAKTLPANRATIARGIANYTINPLSLSTKGGHREQALADAARIDPTFDSVNYAARAKAVRDFATGKHGDTTRSLNVAIDHLGTLDEAAKALGNGDSKLINTVRNKWRDQVGSELPGNFAAVRSIVGDEVVKAVIGSGGGALGDREEIKHNIDAQKSPEALAGIIKQYKKLMAGQLHGIQQQYENTTGLRNFHERLSPATLAELNAASTPASEPSTGLVEGRTGTDASGRKVIVRGGKVVPL